MKKRYLMLLLIVIIGLSPKYGISKNADKDFTLVAVLVVGHQEDGTKDAMLKMDEIADFLTSRNVRVKKYYNKNAVWENIKKGAKDANFFIYSGHGSNLGDKGKAGGLCLTTMVSADKMQDLRLANNAMVIFKSVCNGAGSSASDNGDIGKEEAINRVEEYSKPFIEAGAGCYYANNLGDGCLSFLMDLFEGQTVSQAYINSTSTWAKIELDKNYKYNRSMHISIASVDWGGTSTRITYTNRVKKVRKVKSFKNYDIAYVAPESFSLDGIKSKW